jgi:hypothetical protein
MSAILVLLPLLLVPFLYAALVKLAAFVFRRTKLSWKHALLFALMAFLVGVAGTLLNKATGSLLPLPLAALISFSIQLALGGWYLGSRASTQQGAPLAFKGGIVLSLVAHLMVVVAGVAAAVVVPLVQQAGHA